MKPCPDPCLSLRVCGLEGGQLELQRGLARGGAHRQKTLSYHTILAIRRLASWTCIVGYV